MFHIWQADKLCKVTA